MERIQPHAGPGREPARAITGSELAAVGGINQTVYAAPDPSGYGGMVVLDQSGSPVRTSPPPAAPEAASEMSTLRTEVGRLTAAIGDLKAQQELERMETALRLEATLAGAPSMSNGRPNIPLPPGVSEHDSLNVGQLLAVMGEVFPALQAQAMRAGWGITEAEEAQVLQANPQLNSVPEPRRSQLIKAFADLRRAKAAPSAPTPPERTAPTRAASPTVPVVEQPSAPTMVAASDFAGSTGEDAATLAWTRYRELEAKLNQVRTPKERRQVLAEMKQAMVTAMAAQNISLDQYGKSSWTQA